MYQHELLHHHHHHLHCIKVLHLQSLPVSPSLIPSYLPPPASASASQEAPGQLLTHYSPDIPTRLLPATATVAAASDAADAADAPAATSGGAEDDGSKAVGEVGKAELAGAVVLDFGAQWAHLRYLSSSPAPYVCLCAVVVGQLLLLLLWGSGVGTG